MPVTRRHDTVTMETFTGHVRTPQDDCCSGCFGKRFLRAYVQMHRQKEVEIMQVNFGRLMYETDVHLILPTDLINKLCHVTAE